MSTTTVKEKKKSKTIIEAEQMSALLESINEYVVLDIETTGLTPLKGGFIIEIAGVKVKDNQIVDTFSQLIHPGSKIYKQTIELTGITNEMLEGKPAYGQVLPEFHRFIGDLVVVAHNAIFDWDRFLLYYFKKVGLSASNKVIDTLKLSKLYNPNRDSHKLGDLCRDFGIDLANAHRALDDTIATAKLTMLFKEKFTKATATMRILGEEVSQSSLFDEPVNVQELKTSFKIRQIRYWEKKLTKSKVMQRIYVNIGIGNVYFDIPTQAWYNKDVKEPICFKSLQEQVLVKLQLRDVVDLCFYRN